MKQFINQLANGLFYYRIFVHVLGLTDDDKDWDIVIQGQDERGKTRSRINPDRCKGMGKRVEFSHEEEKGIVHDVTSLI